MEIIIIVLIVVIVVILISLSILFFVFKNNKIIEDAPGDTVNQEPITNVVSAKECPNLKCLRVYYKEDLIGVSELYNNISEICIEYPLTIPEYIELREQLKNKYSRICNLHFSHVKLYYEDDIIKMCDFENKNRDPNITTTFIYYNRVGYDTYKRYRQTYHMSCIIFKHVLLTRDNIENMSDCFHDCTFDIPYVVTEIGNCAFENCINLKCIQIPHNIKAIGPLAFGYCTNLERIFIPQNVKIIDSLAFKNCTNLNKVEIPFSTKIKDDAFEKCTNIEIKRY